MEYDNNHFIIASRAYSLHPGCKTKTEGELEGGQGPTTLVGGAPLAHATTWCGGPGPPLTSPVRLFKASIMKTLNQLAFSQ
jgi:hypothetical protein